MIDLSWYIGRAATMSPAELVWRAWRFTTDMTGISCPRERADSTILAVSSPDWNAMLQAFRSGTGRPILLDQTRADRIATRYPAQVKELLNEAERLLAGERTYFGYPTVNLGTEIDWNCDPVAGYRWPALAARRVNHRTASGDPKWIWELNRLQHLPLLTQAWLFTGDDRFAEAALDQIDSWMDQNPVGTGIAWRGAFEAAIRGMSVAVAAQGLRTASSMTATRYRRIVRMLDASARYCWSGRSLHSSANNHLVGELAGLISLGLLQPELARPKSLRPRAIETLVDHGGKQILADGAGAEQSITYQMFCVELICLVIVLLRLDGAEIPAGLPEILDRSADYLIGLTGSIDPPPRYGDDDDGLALRLGAEHKRTVREHLGIVAAVTGNDAARRYGTPTLTAAWFADALGTDLSEIGDGIGTDYTPTDFHAPQGGMVVLRRNRQRITMDVGALGYLSIAAHGHADALAVTVSADGRDLVVDPGTASYYGEPKWRAVHRGTRAHPTVCVDNADQSVAGGPFYWQRHAVTTVNAVDLERGVIDAQHDGYRRFADPVVHRRWLISPPRDTTVAVVDLLDGRAEHDVALSWPLQPDLCATSQGNGHLVSREGRVVLQLCYAATAPVVVEQIRGDYESGLGWWSDRLESRMPAWVVGARCCARLPLAILTVLNTAEGDAVVAPTIVQEGPLLVVGWRRNSVRTEWAIDTTLPGAVAETASG